MYLFCALIAIYPADEAACALQKENGFFILGLYAPLGIGSFKKILMDTPFLKPPARYGRVNIDEYRDIRFYHLRIDLADPCHRQIKGLVCQGRQEIAIAHHMNPLL